MAVLPTFMKLWWLDTLNSDLQGPRCLKIPLHWFHRESCSKSSPSVSRSLDLRAPCHVVILSHYRLLKMQHLLSVSHILFIIWVWNLKIGLDSFLLTPKSSHSQNPMLSFHVVSLSSVLFFPFPPALSLIPCTPLSLPTNSSTSAPHVNPAFPPPAEWFS